MKRNIEDHCCSYECLYGDPDGDCGCCCIDCRSAEMGAETVMTEDPRHPICADWPEVEFPDLKWSQPIPEQMIGTIGKFRLVFTNAFNHHTACLMRGKTKVIDFGVDYRHPQGARMGILKALHQALAIPEFLELLEEENKIKAIYHGEVKKDDI